LAEHPVSVEFEPLIIAMNASARPSSRRGYTLLEMCVVMFILLLFLTAGLPAIQSAFTEQDLRSDSRELALCVRTAVLQSNDQHRPYVIELTSSNFYLHPVEPLVEQNDGAGQNVPAGNDANADPNSAPHLEDVEEMHTLNKPTKLLVPDPEKPKAWIPLTPTQWVFHPGTLYIVPRVRFTRGDAWIELGFNPLTGNVEDESNYFP
jgi:prepilin-type N-terminal cleavage/methylation domain-containing protein